MTGIMDQAVVGEGRARPKKKVTWNIRPQQANEMMGLSGRRRPAVPPLYARGRVSHQKAADPREQELLSILREKENCLKVHRHGFVSQPLSKSVNYRESSCRGRRQKNEPEMRRTSYSRARTAPQLGSHLPPVSDVPRTQTSDLYRAEVDRMCKLRPEFGGLESCYEDICQGSVVMLHTMFLDPPRQKSAGTRPVGHKSIPPAIITSHVTDPPTTRGALTIQNATNTLRNLFRSNSTSASSKPAPRIDHHHQLPSRFRALQGLSLFTRGILQSKRKESEVNSSQEHLPSPRRSSNLSQQRNSLSDSNLNMDRRPEKSTIPRPKSDILDRRITPLVAIDLKNEDGEQEQVEIDEVDEELLKEVDRGVPTPLPQYGRCRRQSITDRLQKRRSSEIAADIIRLSAQNRRREFCELLDEHAKLVEEIMRSEAMIECEKENEDQESQDPKS